MLIKSIKTQVVTALVVQFAVLVGIVSTTIYLLDLRRHDYVILNLSGQLRVISQGMVRQSLNYVEQAPRDYQTYERDLLLYRKDLMEHIAGYETIINAFKARNLSPELVSYSNLGQSQSHVKIPSLLSDADAIYCTWDGPSRSQLDETAQVWEKFRMGLVNELGPDTNAPRLEAAAKYIMFNENELMRSATDLTLAFRAMMESKLDDIRLLNRASIILSFFIGVTILFILYRKIFRPIDRTVQGFMRVAQGDLQYQVPVDEGNELGHLTATFNKMTRRMSSLFRLTDRINQATNLDDTLKFVFEEFRGFLPLDWVALVLVNRHTHAVSLERVFHNSQSNLHERDTFLLEDTLLSNILADSKPVCVASLQSESQAYPKDELLRGLQSGSMQSLIVLPLSLGSVEQGMLMFASHEVDAYNPGQLELLENIAGQVSRGFEKTIGMENLVISAVEGLAKLAESRDPETGDHLFRMSRYSAILAEELGTQGKYQAFISSAYVRDVLRFAPMHDIGKVGIEDSILLKPGKLDEQEWNEMKQHPVIGAQVLRRCEEQMNAVGHSIFAVGIEIAESHHEKFNGEGYPHQLMGEEIPLSARIVAAADVFDALTSRRPYKEAWPVEKAMQLMREESGRHFDPEIVEALERCLPRILSIYEKHKHV